MRAACWTPRRKTTERATRCGRRLRHTSRGRQGILVHPRQFGGVDETMTAPPGAEQPGARAGDFGIPHEPPESDFRPPAESRRTSARSLPGRVHGRATPGGARRGARRRALVAPLAACGAGDGGSGRRAPDRFSHSCDSRPAPGEPRCSSCRWRAPPCPGLRRSSGDGRAGARSGPRESRLAPLPLRASAGTLGRMHHPEVTGRRAAPSTSRAPGNARGRSPAPDAAPTPAGRAAVPSRDAIRLGPSASGRRWTRAVWVAAAWE